MSARIHLQYVIDFDMMSSRLTTNFDNNINDFPDELLIGSYLFYLGRFYRIAEDSISAKVKTYLNSVMSKSKSLSNVIVENYIQEIFNMSMETFSPAKRLVPC